MPSISENISADYEGGYAGQFIAPAILSGRMINQDFMTRFLGIKSKMQVPLINIDGVIKPYATDFEADADTINLSKKTLDPKSFMVNLEFPIDILEGLYLSESMMAGMHNSSVPSNFQDFIIQYVTEHVGNNMDKFIWNSDTAGSGINAQFDGLLKQMDADSDVVDVSLTALTAANVVANLNKVYEAIPEDSSEDPNLKFFMSIASHKKYKQAVANQGLNTTSKRVEASMLYDENIEVVSIPGFPSDTVVATSSGNLVFGTDLESDMQRFRIVDMRFTTNDNKLRFRMDFKADVLYAFGEQVVLARVS